MTFFQIYSQAFTVIFTMMFLLWLISVYISNVSIVDLFWGLGFVLACVVYYYQSEGYEPRKLLILVLTILWGLRLSIYLTWRNMGKGEDFRYRKFRQDYGEKRYWWISFFQTFLFQGFLMWLISAPLLGAQHSTNTQNFNSFDFLGVICWLIGIFFETVGDYQLAKFKLNPQNTGKVLDSGLWKYTRHPNYFGDAAVWFGFALFSLAGGSYLPVLGSLLMIFLIIKVSGVALLEKSLIVQKSKYELYVSKTSSFIPWFPKNNKL